MNKINQGLFAHVMCIEMEVATWDSDLHGVKRLTYNPYYREFTLTAGRLIKHFAEPADACEAYNTL